jgi:hypothetical protein
MNKRPKSREETPKEGSDSARRYRTATICGRAAQNASPFETFPAQYSAGWRICNRVVKFYFHYVFQLLIIVFRRAASVTCLPQSTEISTL